MEPKLFYQQPAARVWYVSPKYLDGKYQLFYLKNWRDHNAPGFVPVSYTHLDVYKRHLQQRPDDP